MVCYSILIESQNKRVATLCYFYRGTSLSRTEHFWGAAGDVLVLNVHEAHFSLPAGFSKTILTLNPCLYCKRHTSMPTVFCDTDAAEEAVFPLTRVFLIYLSINTVTYDCHFVIWYLQIATVYHSLVWFRYLIRYISMTVKITFKNQCFTH